MRRMLRTWMAGCGLVLVLAMAGGCCMCRPGMGGGARPDHRAGWVAAVRPDQAAPCKALCAQVPPAARKALRGAGLRNSSIYFKTIDGRPYLFAYLEAAHHGRRGGAPCFAGELQQVPWFRELQACLAPLPGAPAGGGVWNEAEEVYHFAGAAERCAKTVARYGTVTGLKLDKEAWYRILHKTPWGGVNQQIQASGIRDYTIYLMRLGEKLYLLSYFEYVGGDFAGDMAKMKQSDVTRRWWQQTDPCQLPLPDAAVKGEIWEGMDEVLHLP